MEQRSVFVNVVGWIFLVLSGLGVLECIVLMFIPWQQFMSQAQMHSAQMPPDAQLFGTEIMHVTFAAGLIFGLWVVASSIGLLLRQNWARISYIVLMALGIGFNALYFLIGILMLVIFHTTGFRNNPAFPPGTSAFASAFMIVWVIFTAVFLALFIWILIKLTSETVVREFRPPSGLQA